MLLISRCWRYGCLRRFGAFTFYGYPCVGHLTYALRCHYAHVYHTGVDYVTSHHLRTFDPLIPRCHAHHILPRCDPATFARGLLRVWFTFTAPHYCAHTVTPRHGYTPHILPVHTSATVFMPLPPAAVADLPSSAGSAAPARCCLHYHAVTVPVPLVPFYLRLSVTWISSVTGWILRLVTVRFSFVTTLSFAFAFCRATRGC